MIQLSLNDIFTVLNYGYYETDLSLCNFNAIRDSFHNKIETPDRWAKKDLKEKVCNILSKEKSVTVLHSSGVDSTFMLCMAMECFDSRNINIVRVGYDKFDTNEEWGLSNKILDSINYKDGITVKTLFLNREHMYLTLNSLTKDNYKNFFISSSLIPTHWAIDTASLYDNTIVTGDAGDELFCGYDRYLIYNYFNSSSFLLKLFSGLLRFQDRRKRKFLDFVKSGYTGMVKILDKEDINKLLTKYYALEYNSYKYDNSIPSIHFIKNESFDNRLNKVERCMLYDIGTELFGIEKFKVDTAVRLANNPKIVSPFFNMDLIKWCCSLPTEMKFRNGTRKWLLREIINDYIPEYKNIVSKRKLGFANKLVKSEYEYADLLINKLIEKEIIGTI